MRRVAIQNPNADDSYWGLREQWLKNYIRTAKDRKETANKRANDIKPYLSAKGLTKEQRKEKFDRWVYWIERYNEHKKDEEQARAELKALRAKLK